MVNLVYKDRYTLLPLKPFCCKTFICIFPFLERFEDWSSAAQMPLSFKSISKLASFNLAHFQEIP